MHAGGDEAGAANAPPATAEPDATEDSVVIEKPAAEAERPVAADAAIAAAHTEPQILSYETLESIIELDPSMGEGLLQRLIRMYEPNSVELLETIQTAFAADDAESTAKAAPVRATSDKALAVDSISGKQNDPNSVTAGGRIILNVACTLNPSDPAL